MNFFKESNLKAKRILEKAKELAEKLSDTEYIASEIKKSLRKGLKAMALYSGIFR